MILQTKTWINFFFAICCILLSNSSTANDKILKDAIPSWVTSVNLPSISPLPKKQIRNGVYYLLVDAQTLIDKDKEPQFYRHNAEYITNQSGVESNSQINLSYDPSYQKLIMHSLKIIRHDQVIDKMQSARMKVIQREEDMDNLIYNGRLTLNIILDDVRVGDIIEYSYSTFGDNPVYQNIFSYEHSLNWTVPVALVSIRLLWNKSTPLYHLIEKSPLKLDIKPTKQGTEYLIQSQLVKPVLKENNTPYWFSPWGRIYFSELKSWKEVANWSHKLYINAVSSNIEIKQLAKDIQSKISNKQEQISAALRFVQDNIRYLGIELGKNSHLPKSASITLNNRYGDCKDKTALLISILNELGFKAFPALVNTENKLNNTLPSINAFDHVITYLKYNEEHFWLDPTRRYQHGGIDKIYQPDYGKALILNTDTLNLTQMNTKRSRSGTFITDKFLLSSKESAYFYSKTKSFGFNAERLEID
jgi:hypothetical protein